MGRVSDEPGGDYRRALRLEAAIVEIMREPAVWNAPADEALRVLLRRIASALEVERVGVWLYDAQRVGMDGRLLFERTPGRFGEGARIVQTDYPAYFAALADADVVPASDARSDARTRELRDAYLVPFDVHSLLDAPLFLGGELAGVLCHEAVASPREWRPDEVHFAVWAATTVSHVLDRERRARAAAAAAGIDGHVLALVNAADVAIVSASLEDRIVRFANPAADRAIGGALAGRRVDDVLPPDVGPVYEEAREGPWPFYGRTVVRELRKVDGSPFVVEATSSFMSHGGERFVVAVAHDLGESELRFRATFDDAPVGVAHVAFDGTILRANGLFCELVGVARADLRPFRGALDVQAPPNVSDRGPTFDAAVRFPELGLTLDGIRAAIASGRGPCVLEQRFPREGRDDRWIELRVSLALGAQQQPAFFVVFAYDVTSRRRTTEAFRQMVAGASATGSESCEQLARALSTAIGARCAAILELVPDRVGQARSVAIWADGALAPGVELPIVGSPLEVVVAAGSFHATQGVAARFPGCALVRALNADGFLGVRLDDAAGQPIGVMAVVFDTLLDAGLDPHDVLRIFAARASAELGRMRAEATVRLRENSLRHIADALDEAIWLAEWPSRKALFVGARYAATFGGAREGKSIDARLDAVHPDDRDGVAAATMAAGEAASEGTFRVLGADGAVRWIRERVFPVLGYGAVTRIAGIATDVTRTRGTEDALRATEQRLAEALRVSGEHASRLDGAEELGLVGLLGQSAPMRDAYERIRLASERDVTVLLTGESGTGKELAAAAIHTLSARRDRPFIPVNCAAIPESLLESELFGHVRGSFTGAVRDKVGLLQAAHGGTLFLDEIGELGASLQVKLLRALETREIRRVGDEKSIAIDVRLVTATHRDLRALVAGGTFREDFYYRIRVFEIELPPLRARRDDIPALAAHFVATLGKGRAPAALGSDAVRALMQYPWHGNVRELRNAIEHALVTLRGDVIHAADLPPEIGGRPRAPGPALPATPDEERARIEGALRSSGGNRSEAARQLGISRVTLWKKMRKLKIAGADD